MNIHVHVLYVATIATIASPPLKARQICLWSKIEQHSRPFYPLLKLDNRQIVEKKIMIGIVHIYVYNTDHDLYGCYI